MHEMKLHNQMKCDIEKGWINPIVDQDIIKKLINIVR